MWFARTGVFLYAEVASLLCCQRRGGVFAHGRNSERTQMIRTGLLHIPEIDHDASKVVRALLTDMGAFVLLEEQRTSNRNVLADTLIRWCDEEELDLVLTIGGTLPAPGPSSAECAPDATQSVLDRLAPGLSEAMRAEVSLEHPLALLDRGVAGIRSRTLILNLPEGRAAGLFLAAVTDVVPACVAHLQGDVEAPRLRDLACDSEDAAPEESTEGISAKPGLDAEEFAAFLQRRRQS